MPTSASGVPGFNGHTNYDPFLPSSPSEEQLTQYNTDFESAETSSNGRSPFQGLGDFHSNTRHNIIVSTTDERSPSRDLHPFNVGSPASGTSPGMDEHSRQYNSMSPPTGYPTEFEYAELNGFVAHDYNDNFLLEADFGPLPVPEENTETGNPQQEPLSATSTTSHAISYLSRKSTGVATMSSHLMSPVLTDAASPFSTNGEPKTRLLGGGSMSRMSSQSTTTEAANIHEPLAYAQNTPALTGSPGYASPELASKPFGASNVSPVVRIESYTRGDSPARNGEIAEHTRTKRRRGSKSHSHLAAPSVGMSEYGGDEEDDVLDYRGLDPSARAAVMDNSVPNFQDQEESKELEAKNAEVHRWLTTSEGPDAAPIGIRRYALPGGRRRAKSAVDQAEFEGDHQDAERSKRIPGPGLMLNEVSGDEEEEGFDSSDESAPDPAHIRESNQAAEAAECSGGNYFATLNELGPKDVHPWIDPIYLMSKEGEVGQPATSNAAMMRFLKRAQDIETASRAATWGTTNRRMSEADIERIIAGPESLLSRFSISREKGAREKGDRRGSFLEAAAKLLPKRSNSNARRKASEPTRHTYGASVVPESTRKESLHRRKESLRGSKESLHDRKESLGSRAGSPSAATAMKRIPSVGRGAKSPKVNTGSAVLSVATQIATLGGNGSVTPPATSSPTTGPLSWIKRTARGEFHRTSSQDQAEPGLAELWNKQGGPPLPLFTSPPEEKMAAMPLVPPVGGEEDADADTDEVTDEKGVSMNFMPSVDLIIPTFDGFKRNVKDVNPRLPTYLVERLGQEQLRRYKKLVEFKVKHAQAKQLGNCNSGVHCTDKGGSPKYFPTKANEKEPLLSHTGFTTAGLGDADEDADAIADGAVTAAQFPLGMPIPPVKRLPAQFECPLCFTVKRFQKPSDWSKHVHEDLQPFTCTFPTCPDPKSFKRKADWVRHENERHRQLEWWKCTEDGCSHQCYRRDNFLQHLVREHKMPEPKAKIAKPNKPAVRGPAKNKNRSSMNENKDIAPEDRVSVLVEKCRHETPKDPINEPCRFCGNMCNSWKKLTVHLARHMEQISMPILRLVDRKDVSPDTIISPMEQKILRQDMISLAEPFQYSHRESVAIGPYDMPPVGMDNVKHELSNPVTPLQASVVAFNPPSYENQVTGKYPWGHSSTQRSQLQPPALSTPYNGGISGAYMHGNDVYRDNESPPQMAVPSTHLNYVQPHRVSRPEVHYSMSGGLSHMPQTHYPSGNAFHTGPTEQHQPQSFLNNATTAPYPQQRDFPSTYGQQMPTSAEMPVQHDGAAGLPYARAPNEPPIFCQRPQENYYVYQTMYQG